MDVSSALSAPMLRLLPIPVETVREEGFGYQFEARHVGECLRLGLVESPVMSHADSVSLMETLDEVRRICSIVYPADS